MPATPITVLGLETSCDETAAAIVRLTPDDTQAGGVRSDILSNVVLSQIELHAPYGGVVPEIAARAHIEHLDRLVADSLDEAGCKLSDMSAIAATAGPGLIGGVLIGLTTGKALALASGAPFYGINHLEGHALTVRLTHDVVFPYLLLLVSGGHCQLCRVDGVGDYTLLGTTRDDAVGEAFDKAAKLLGLGYPGGPEIEAHAARGNASRFALPRPLIGLDDSGCDFSFSGLKTALRQQALALQPISETDICDLAASFQAAIADCLTDRCRVAIEEFRASSSDTGRLIVAGGVAANQFLRYELDGVAVDAGFTLTVPPPALCTDNAAMIAWAGAERLHAGSVSETGFAEPARARWPLTETAL